MEAGTSPDRARAVDEFMAPGAMTLPGGKLWYLESSGIVFYKGPFFSMQSVISLVTCTSFTAFTPAGVYRLKMRRNIFSK